MATEAEETDGGRQRDPMPWRLPSYIREPTVRRAWLEAAERSWSEGYGEDFERRRLRRITLKLLYWRGIEVPPEVSAKVFATTDLERLRSFRDRAFEVADPAGLFISEKAE